MSRLARLRYVHLAGFRRDEYALYRLGERSPEEARRYLSARQMHNVVRPALNDHRYNAVLEDKWLFARIFDQAGVPMPRTLGVIHPGWGVTREGEPLRTASDLGGVIRAHGPGGLVFKPLAGYKGRQLIFAEAEVGKEVRLTVEGRPRSLEDLVASLPLDGFFGISGFLVQERVSPHAEVAALNPDALNTLRLHTFLRSDGGVLLDSAILRLGRRGRPLEELSTGGIAVEIDLERGILGEGIDRTAIRNDGAYMTHHPDTGVRFQGYALPCWEQVVEVTERAARAVPALRTVGWDVAITSGGAVLLEGNGDFNPRNPQAFGRGYLSDEIRRELAAVGVHQPESEPRLSTLISRLRRRLGRVAIGRVFRWSGLDPHADRWL